MSRRLPSAQRHLPSASDKNPYQPTTVPISSNGRKSGHFVPNRTFRIVFDGDTTDSLTSYNYGELGGFGPSPPLKESANTDYTISEDSGSTRLPYYEFDDEHNIRYSRSYSDRSSKKHKGNANVCNYKDFRKVYPNPLDVGRDRIYQQKPSICDNVPASGLPRRAPPISRLSDRPQSSMSSGVTSVNVYACGGKCQTFENICYFFLQLVFAMGILIGISLCIAGVVLKKSAARNLQVLIYIGALLSLVCALLLSIQCKARHSAKKRQKARMNAKRAPIEMENMKIRVNPTHQPLMTLAAERAIRREQIPQVHLCALRQHQLQENNMDEQGIPWWRRKDVNTLT